MTLDVGYVVATFSQLKAWNCRDVPAKMNEMLACNLDGTTFYETGGTCKCTDTTATGLDCEFSNSKTCNDAGVVDALGHCTCNDRAVVAGLSCEYTNTKTCSDAGIAHSDGTCTCDRSGSGSGFGSSSGFVSGSSFGGVKGSVGAFCYTDEVTCYGNGVAEADGSCTDCIETSTGSHCQFSNKNNCNDAAQVNPDGTCAQPCGLKLGHKGARCGECDTTTHDLIQNGTTVPRITACVLNTMNVQMSGACKLDDGTLSPVNGVYEYQGLTFDGKAFYKNGADIYIYYDNFFCGISNPNPSWIIGPKKPSVTAAEDLDGDGKCRFWGYIDSTSNTIPYGEQRWKMACDGRWVTLYMSVVKVHQSTCDEPTDVPLVTCVPKGDTATCVPGNRSVNGECQPCEANTYADGTRLDGADDGGLRVTCKPCPANSLTRAPTLTGASTVHKCVAQCPPGQRSQDGICVPCAINTFSDGVGADGVSDDNYRTECKPCEGGEISEQGSAVCFAKFQTVPGQLFCYGEGADSKSISANANKDEVVFAFSSVGARDVEPWKSCQEAQKLTLPNATFIPPTQLKCSTDTATAEDCAAAFAKATKSGMTTSMFCDYETRVGDTIGYPAQLCREHNCKGGATGTCWPPELRGETLHPFGCIYNTKDNTVMYYTPEDAKLYYNGFEYDPFCERYICPLDPDAGFQKPVPLKADEIVTQEDTKKVPQCRLSARGVDAKTAEASNLNNKIFIPIAISISVLCMLVAACLTADELNAQWIAFGVGLRTFDMQTDWGFFAISLKDLGFQAKALYGDEIAEGYNYDQLLADGDVMTEAQLNRMVKTCLAFCIIGTLLTPFDILGNLARTESKHANEFAVLISILILGFEDIPQLYLNAKFIGIMGAGDPISVLSLVASIINIAYNVIVVLYDFGRM